MKESDAFLYAIITNLNSIDLTLKRIEEKMDKKIKTAKKAIDQKMDKLIVADKKQDKKMKKKGC